ncbi:MAG: carboxypeptidase regulatory-like domain-containing protein [Bryobacterales bacterium]|nr:carboxypeptidase regulatory-like domain-containing protein [Bryobacterales bacterium]
MTTQILSLLLVFSAGLAFGQPATGQIGGMVSDNGNGAVAEASITATEVTERTPHSARTTASGTYMLAKLKPGTYEIVTEAEGFLTAKQNVFVVAGSEVQVNIKLRRSVPSRQK